MALWFKNNTRKDKILDWEKELYSSGKVADKYDILERIRLELDRLYKEDRPKYDNLEKALKPNTWEALEDNWTVWNPVPKNHAEWVGPGEMTCRLKATHSNYQECVDKCFTECIHTMNMVAPISVRLLSRVILLTSQLYMILFHPTIYKREEGVQIVFRKLHK